MPYSTINPRDSPFTLEDYKTIVKNIIEEAPTEAQKAAQKATQETRLNNFYKKKAQEYQEEHSRKEKMKKSATKIQALFRGHSTRKKKRSIKKGSRKSPSVEFIKTLTHEEKLREKFREAQRNNEVIDLT